MSSDRIILEGVQFYAYHGSSVEERDISQPFVVTLEAELDLQLPARSDQLEDTVSYTHLYRKAKEVMKGSPRSLLEAVVEPSSLAATKRSCEKLMSRPVAT